MKTLRTISLIILISLITNNVFGQGPIKQYYNGSKGSVVNAANALGDDFSDCSTLQLKSSDPDFKENFASQNFIFSPEVDNTTRIAFVIKLEDKLE